MDDPTKLLPEDARHLREYFKNERITEGLDGEIGYEVEAQDIRVRRHRKNNYEDNVILTMSASGVLMFVPVTRALLKRLKREFETQERLHKRLLSGESEHKEMLGKHNFIAWS